MRKAPEEEIIITKHVSQLNPSFIGKKISEINQNTFKETIDEAKSFLPLRKLNSGECRLIWKGVFQAIWQSDKGSALENLAEELASLIFRVNNGKKFEGPSIWIESCFNTLSKEWSKVNQQNTKKFATLAKQIMLAFLRFLRKKGFNLEYVRRFHSIVQKELYGEISETVEGLALQVIKVFPEVLSQFSNANQEQMMLLLELFIKQLGSSSSKQLREEIRENVFQKIVEMQQTSPPLFENFNMKAYRDKLVHMSNKDKTDETMRKELKKLVKMIDSKVDLEKEEIRYAEYLVEREKGRQERREKWDPEGKKALKEEMKAIKVADQKKQGSNDKGQKINGKKKQSQTPVENDEVQEKPVKKVKNNEGDSQKNDLNSEDNSQNTSKLSKNQKKAIRKEQELQKMMEEAEIKHLTELEQPEGAEENEQESEEKNEIQATKKEKKLKDKKKVAFDTKQNKDKAIKN